MVHNFFIKLLSTETQKCVNKRVMSNIYLLKEYQTRTFPSETNKVREITICGKVSSILV